jgi:hypothetical protein
MPLIVIHGCFQLMRVATWMGIPMRRRDVPKSGIAVLSAQAPHWRPDSYTLLTRWRPIVTAMGIKIG